MLALRLACLSFIWDYNRLQPLAAYPYCLSVTETQASSLLSLVGRQYLLGLATPKVYRAFVVTNKAVGSYPTFSPLPIVRWFFSVALAVSQPSWEPSC